MNKAVAVVGMCGSGKSVLCSYFTDMGWSSVYFGGVAVSQLKKNGIPVTEANERQIREQLRADLGMGAFAVILKEEIIEKLAKGNVVLDGLYSWSEYVILKELLGDNLVVLAVVTNSEIRKQRLKSRPIRPLTEEMVDSRDIAEIENSEKGGPIAKADYYVINNGTERQLKKQFRCFMKWFNKK
ncbi:MAG: AAA family ATPase [Clostridiales bacterium]|nr:AAA family ATPase [Clostridiales bacterium]